MTDIDTVLSEAKNPDGTRRFYPAGQHPATQRLRDHLARLKELDDGGSDSLAQLIEELIEDDERELARFEYGEDKAKRDYLRAMGLS